MLPLKLQNLGVLAVLLGSCMANLVNFLPEHATAEARRLQPSLDFDKDGCFQTAAVSPKGELNPGLSPFDDECRNANRLSSSQTYVRQRCNHGWCAYLYGYYFESDKRARDGAQGHRNDWEHVIVWTQNNDLVYVSWSAHGDYTSELKRDVRFDGEHAKIVYHRGGWNTNSFRKAISVDDKNIENPTKNWFRAPLLSMEWMDCDVKKALLYNDWGSAHPDLRLDRFGEALDKAMPQWARREGFTSRG